MFLRLNYFATPRTIFWTRPNIDLKLEYTSRSIWNMNYCNQMKTGPNIVEWHLFLICLEHSLPESDSDVNLARSCTINIVLKDLARSTSFCKNLARSCKIITSGFEQGWFRCSSTWRHFLQNLRTNKLVKPKTILLQNCCNITAYLAKLLHRILPLIKD